MTTLTQLKALINAQFPTNGVGAIQAVNARAALSTAINNVADTIFTQSYLSPTPNTFNKAILTTQSGPIDGSLIPNDIVIDPFIFGYNYIHVTADQATTSDVRTCAHAFLVDYTFGGANMSGARAAFGAYSVFAAATSPTNWNTDYIGAVSRIDVNSADNGTNVGAGARGSAFAHNLVVAAESATIVTNWFHFCGMEIDFSLNAGTTAKFLTGIASLKLNNDIRGTVVDAAYSVGGNGNCYWNTGFTVTDMHGTVGIAPTGTILGFSYAAAVAQPWNFANGIDLRNASFTGYAFASDGFLVKNTIGVDPFAGSPPTVMSVFNGRGSSPVTDFNTPSVMFTRNESIASGAGASFSSTFVATVYGQATNNAQSNAVVGIAFQYGNNDAVGVSGIGAYNGPGTHVGFGGYFEGQANTLGSTTCTAIAVESTTKNNTGLDKPYQPIPVFDNLGMVGFDITYQDGIYGTKIGSHAIGVRTNNAQWDVGLAFMEGNFIKTASIRDDTQSTTFAAVNGTHVNGYDFTGATFTGSAIKGHLPTSSAGLASGSWWANSGVVTIVA